MLMWFMKAVVHKAFGDTYCLADLTETYLFPHFSSSNVTVSTVLNWGFKNVYKEEEIEKRFPTGCILATKT